MDEVTLAPAELAEPVELAKPTESAKTVELAMSTESAEPVLADGRPAGTSPVAGSKPALIVLGDTEAEVCGPDGLCL